MDMPSTRCCIWGGRGFVRFMPLVSLPGGSRHNRPSEALFLASAGSKLRFGFASLAWSCPRYAISDGGFALTLAGFGLFGEEVVGEGGDVGYIDGAVGVDVGDCFAVGF